MLTGNIRNQIDAVWDAFWSGGFSNPLEVNMSNINATEVLKYPVVLPPLAEQRRIAEVLDRAEALRAKRRAALAQLDSLTQSLFLDLFGEKLDAPPIDTCPDRAHVPRGCSWELLTDVARLATGHTPDRERSDYWNGEIPWISLTDIRSLDGTEATSTLQNVTPLGIGNSSSVRSPAFRRRGAREDGRMKVFHPREIADFPPAEAGTPNPQRGEL